MVSPDLSSLVSGKGVFLLDTEALMSQTGLWLADRFPIRHREEVVDMLDRRLSSFGSWMSGASDTVVTLDVLGEVTKRTSRLKPLVPSSLVESLGDFEHQLTSSAIRAKGLLHRRFNGNYPVFVERLMELEKSSLASGVYAAPGHLLSYTDASLILSSSVLGVGVGSKIVSNDRGINRGIAIFYDALSERFSDFVAMSGCSVDELLTRPSVVYANSTGGVYEESVRVQKRLAA